MQFVHAKLVTCLIFLAVASPGAAQNPPSGLSSFAIDAIDASYSDIADLVVISPMIVDASVRRVQKVAPEQAIGVPATQQRVLIEADVMALIRGDGGVVPQVRLVVDLPKDAKGKIPKLKKQRVFLFGRQVAGRPGDIQLSRPNAIALYNPANDSLVRNITRETVQLNAPRRITGIASAFHSAGTVLGEGETQIFLKTENEQPLSLTILSRPGEQKQWAVSTAEVIDASATAPQRFTLLWYRLACGLPRSLPSELVEGATSESAARAQADYKYVIDALGPCGRKR